MSRVNCLGTIAVEVADAAAAAAGAGAVLVVVAAAAVGGVFRSREAGE